MSSPTAPSSAADRAARVRFRRALALMVMTLLVPGSAQLAAGNRKVGLAALRTWLAALVAGVLLLLVSLVHRQFLFDLAFDTTLLQLFRLVLIAGAMAGRSCSSTRGGSASR